MALQWMILTWVVATEAVVAALLTLPAPRAVRNQIVALTSLLLHPFASILPFAGFNLLDIYWKKEHRLMCTSEVCTADERIHFEKSIFKAQRNVILCVSACLLYWCICCIVKYNKDIKALQEAEKRLKED
ncbi:uncharacterized protein LOC133916549 [Phragmites australis]|uniref:uncharacterized protein LOC133916549 n=1 Tax=Phragmites australis TaxID=29695 RepID=UPI002D774FE2|nr:uncharacterized protein LOC133916549 [Phragmites australis]XP_062216237.1 uncharacterized protein LOC133916549 [Phragmites australis]